MLFKKIIPAVMFTLLLSTEALSQSIINSIPRSPYNTSYESILDQASPINENEKFAKRFYFGVGGGVRSFQYDLFVDGDAGNYAGQSDSFDIDDSFLAEIALGYYITPKLRTDFMYIYSEHQTGPSKNGSGLFPFSEQTLFFNTFLWNVYYDLVNPSYFLRPYIGAGIGATIIRDRSRLDDTRMTLAGHGGFIISIAEDIDLALQGRYTSSGTSELYDSVGFAEIEERKTFETSAAFKFYF